jgi:hypothetical protein
MANVYLNLVWNLHAKLEKTERLILLRYADRADDEGIAFPGIRSVARDCGITLAYVSKTIRKLIDNGFLLEVGKTRKGTRKLQLSREALVSASRPAQHPSGTGIPRSRLPAIDSARRPVVPGATKLLYPLDPNHQSNHQWNHHYENPHLLAPSVRANQSSECLEESDDIPERL